MPETSVNMESKMGWSEFLNLYSKINCLSPTPTPFPSLTSTGFSKYKISSQDIRDVVEADPVESRKSSPYIRYDNSFGDEISTSKSAFPFSKPKETCFTPLPTYYDTSDESKSSTPLSSPRFSPPPSPRSPRYHWGPRSRSFSPPASPTRPFSNTYKQVPEQPANAQGEYVYLPLPAQMKVLSKVQTHLENACFSFAQKVLPQILQKNGWDCPEAGELHVWMQNFANRYNLRTLEYRARNCDIMEPMSALMESAKQIRHAAVHRNRLTVTYLATLMDHAVAFCTILGELDDLAEVEAIRDCTNTKISEIESVTHEASKDILKFMKSR